MPRNPRPQYGHHLRSQKATYSVLLADGQPEKASRPVAVGYPGVAFPGERHRRFLHPAAEPSK